MSVASAVRGRPSRGMLDLHRLPGRQRSLGERAERVHGDAVERRDDVAHESRLLGEPGTTPSSRTRSFEGEVGHGTGLNATGTRGAVDAVAPEGSERAPCAPPRAGRRVHRSRRALPAPCARRPPCCGPRPDGHRERRPGARPDTMASRTSVATFTRPAASARSGRVGQAVVVGMRAREDLDGRDALLDEGALIRRLVRKPTPPRLSTPIVEAAPAEDVCGHSRTPCRHEHGDRSRAAPPCRVDDADDAGGGEVRGRMLHEVAWPEPFLGRGDEDELRRGRVPDAACARARAHHGDAARVVVHTGVHLALVALPGRGPSVQMVVVRREERRLQPASVASLPRRMPMTLWVSTGVPPGCWHREGLEERPGVASGFEPHVGERARDSSAVRSSPRLPRPRPRGQAPPSPSRDRPVTLRESGRQLGQHLPCRPAPSRQRRRAGVGRTQIHEERRVGRRPLAAAVFVGSAPSSQIKCFAVVGQLRAEARGRTSARSFAIQPTALSGSAGCRNVATMPWPRKGTRARRRARRHRPHEQALLASEARQRGGSSRVEQPHAAVRGSS